MTIAEQLRAEGLQKGLQQGLQQGLQKGLQQGQRATLEKLLTMKFGPLSPAVTARLHTADRDTLDRWLERVLAAESIDAVLSL